MAVTTYMLDGADLPTVESYDLPTAKPTEAARADQRSGDTAGAADYADPPFTIVHIVSADTADDVKAAVEALTQRYIPGARLTWAEDDSPTLDTYLREVECADESYFGSWARVTFSGTRSPFWHGPWTALTPVSCYPWSYAAFTDTIGGEVEAELRLNVIGGQASNFIALGIGAEDSIVGPDTYSAVAQNISGTPAPVETYSGIGVPTKQAEYFLCANVKASNSATKFYPSSGSYPVVGASTEIVGSAVTVPAVAAAFRGMVLGTVQVPCTGMGTVRTGNQFKTLIYASGTGTATLQTAMRIPMDDFCIIAKRTAAINEGFRFEAEDVFVAKNNSGTIQVGSSLLPDAQVYGDHHGLLPGITNYAYLAADCPDNLAVAFTLSGEKRERYLHLARS
jgi:hypothetical protein